MQNSNKFTVFPHTIVIVINEVKINDDTLHSKANIQFVYPFLYYLPSLRLCVYISNLLLSKFCDLIDKISLLFVLSIVKQHVSLLCSCACLYDIFHRCAYIKLFSRWCECCVCVNFHKLFVDVNECVCVCAQLPKHHVHTIFGQQKQQEQQHVLLSHSTSNWIKI